MTKLLPKIVRSVRNLYWTAMPCFIRRRFFRDSRDYWEKRYAQGGNSGSGSYGKFALFKAGVLNDFVAAHNVQTVIEFGCGDGNQLALADYPAYSGIDVSASAIARCMEIHADDATRQFAVLDDYMGQTADLALSLDVIYHLVEDAVFESYMRTLFAAGTRYVIVYASDTDDNRDCQGPHIRHRRWTAWVAANCPKWKLSQRIPNMYPYEGDSINASFADFFVFEKVS